MIFETWISDEMPIFSLKIHNGKLYIPVIEVNDTCKVNAFKQELAPWPHGGSIQAFKGKLSKKLQKTP